LVRVRRPGRTTECHRTAKADIRHHLTADRRGGVLISFGPQRRTKGIINPSRRSHRRPAPPEARGASFARGHTGRMCASRSEEVGPLKHVGLDSVCGSLPCERRSRSPDPPLSGREYGKCRAGGGRPVIPRSRVRSGRVGPAHRGYGT
jgi:hypothetical protein